MLNKKELLDKVQKYIDENIDNEFHNKKLDKVKKLTLNAIIKRKNPYLFKAKGFNNAGDLIKSIIDATVSSGEETIFGSFMEQVAIYTSNISMNGKKSGIEGIDLEFDNEGSQYFVSIKSGPNWGNSGQLKKLEDNFNKIRRVKQTSKSGSSSINLIFIEGCCYGSDNSTKGTHIKLCGQNFWELISGGYSDLYKDIIEPFGHKSKEKTEQLQEALDNKTNSLTLEFIKNYCTPDGAIDWGKIVDHVSKSKKQ